MATQRITPTGCCDPFDPKPWQDKEITWQEKLFVKDHVTSFLHIPLNFGQKVVKNMALIDNAGAKAPYQLMLTDEKSLWGADISQGKNLTKLYLSYTTCPKCAKAYGKNYVVLFAKV